MTESKYIAFRFLIVPIDQHLFAKPMSYHDKIAIFKKNFFKSHDFITPTGSEFAIRITQTENDIAYGKLSRKMLYDLHEKQPHDIKEMTVEDWPFVEFICDTTEKHQLLIMRHNTRIFPKISKIGYVLSEELNKYMYPIGYSVSYEQLVSESTFWDYVKDSEGIYQLSFDLLSPNLFGANQIANESLKSVQELFNNSEIRVSLH